MGFALIGTPLEVGVGDVPSIGALILSSGAVTSVAECESFFWPFEAVASW